MQHLLAQAHHRLFEACTTDIVLSCSGKRTDPLPLAASLSKWKKSATIFTLCWNTGKYTWMHPGQALVNKLLKGSSLHGVTIRQVMCNSCVFAVVMPCRPLCVCVVNSVSIFE